MEKLILPILLSFFATLILCPLTFPLLRKLKFGQFVRDDGPQSHLQKAGTLTMGGLIFLPGFLIGALFFMNQVEMALPIILVVIGYGLIGFLDDYIKVVKKRSLGLRAYQKMIAQLVITGLFIGYNLVFQDLGTDILVPFIKGETFNLGYLYVPFILVVMLGTVNGVNLTDGLDGLATTVTLVVAAFFSVASFIVGVPLFGVSGALIGALLTFLLFNAHPAKVFMGDVGSLALGGFVAAMAVSLKMPLWILFVGIIYLAETVSVMIQVAYFKKTKKRFFKMAPIHHHYELKGLKETKIVAIFSIITLIGALIGVLALL